MWFTANHLPPFNQPSPQHSFNLTSRPLSTHPVTLLAGLPAGLPVPSAAASHSYVFCLCSAPKLLCGPNCTNFDRIRTTLADNVGGSPSTWCE